MNDLSIIIVNWNSLAFAEACIASIEQNLHGISYEVIVVDNASRDAPCDSLVKRFPDVKLILNDQNAGFGGANNLGARRASGKILLFLNPDTLVEGNAIGAIFEELIARPSAGIAGCRLLNRDRSLQLSSVQRYPTIMNQLFSLGYLQRVWPCSPLWGKEALYRPNTRLAHRVDVVSGAALMIKRSVFTDAGGFNPTYFMYAEEVDLCAAVHRLNFEVIHCSKAEIIHFGGESTRQCDDGFADTAMRESVYRFLMSTRGRVYALLFRGSLLLSALCRVIVLAPISLYYGMIRDPAQRRKTAKAWKKWTRIGLWTLSLRQTVVPEAGTTDKKKASKDYTESADGLRIQI